MLLSSVSENRCGDEGGSDGAACDELRRAIRLAGKGVMRFGDGDLRLFWVLGGVGAAGEDCVGVMRR